MSQQTKPNPIVQYFMLDKYWIQYVIIFSLVLVVSALFPQGKALKYSYQLNDVTREPIIAPFTFPILKSEEKLQTDLDHQKRSVPFIFNRHDLTVSKQSEALNEFCG